MFYLYLSLFLFSVVYGIFMREIYRDAFCEHGPKPMQKLLKISDSSNTHNGWLFEYRTKGHYVNGQYKFN